MFLSFNSTFTWEDIKDWEVSVSLHDVTIEGLATDLNLVHLVLNHFESKPTND
jgi:hypothetical protein